MPKTVSAENSLNSFYYQRTKIIILKQKQKNVIMKTPIKRHGNDLLLNPMDT